MLKEKILLLDDDEIIVDLLEEVLSERYEVERAGNGFDALTLMHESAPDIVLVDYNMPEMNGLEFIKAAREDHPDAVFIVMSGNRDMNTAIDAVNSGVWHYIRKPFKDIAYIHQVVADMLERQRLLLENRRYKEDLESLVRERTLELEKKNAELLQSRSRVIGILSRAAEFKDFETGQHFIRVARYSALIATGLGLSPDRVGIIEQAASVHDIGKIGIPEGILLKQGRLSTAEFEEMKNHCLFGEEILRSRSLEDLISHGLFEDTTDDSDMLLTTAARIAKSHHERVDGSGYPLGLKGEEIPLEARIVAVADVYDALGSERHYKQAWPEEECRAFICDNRGILFDEKVVDAFMSSIDSIMEVKLHFMDEECLNSAV